MGVNEDRIESLEKEVSQLRKENAELKKDEEKLLDSEVKLRALLDGSPVCNKIVGLDSRLLFIPATTR